MLLKSRICLPGGLVPAILTLILWSAPTGAEPGHGTDEPSDLCPMSPTPDQVEIELDRHSRGLHDSIPHRDGMIVIPLALHVVRTSNGMWGIPLSRLDQAMIDADFAFAPMGIQFCRLGEINYIDSDRYYYDINGIGDINDLRSESVVPNAINVYFTPNMVYNGVQICGISSFTYSPVQGIVMHNSCTGVPGNPSTFPHELGHYFDLFHTYETAFGHECPDGSNCATAGDRVCDTAADPYMALADITFDCVWTGDDSPPQHCGSMPYDPDPRNYMAFSRPTCRDTFTPGQGERAIAILYNFRPELVYNGCDPASAPDPAVGSVEFAGNFPNPFGPETKVVFELGGEASVSLSIHDASGRMVRILADGMRSSGRHEVLWDGLDGSGRPAAGGVYFLLVDAGHHREIRAMTLLR